MARAIGPGGSPTLRTVPGLRLRLGLESGIAKHILALRASPLAVESAPATLDVEEESLTALLTVVAHVDAGPELLRDQMPRDPAD